MENSMWAVLVWSNHGRISYIDSVYYSEEEADEVAYSIDEAHTRTVLMSNFGNMIPQPFHVSVAKIPKFSEIEPNYEAIFIARTSKDNKVKKTNCIRELHSYEVRIDRRDNFITNEFLGEGFAYIEENPNSYKVISETKTDYGTIWEYIVTYNIASIPNLK